MNANFSYGLPEYPSDEEFHRVGITNHCTSDQDNLVHVLQVADRDEFFEAEPLSSRNGERYNHRKTTEDRTCNEVRREDGRVPTRNLRNCEVKRYNGVNRENEWGRETGEDQVRALVTVPVPGRASPPKREDPVEEFTYIRGCSVTKCREVRNKAEVPKSAEIVA